MITLEQALAEPPPPPLIHYPESDGKPMGDNDQQRDGMNKIIENLKALFADVPMSMSRVTCFGIPWREITGSCKRPMPW
jgi:hypothetical protein